MVNKIMKTNLIFLLLTLTGLTNVSSCKKENLNVLPPETQSGKNTFGCLIDGELFEGGCCAPWMHPIISAGYYIVSDKLNIVVWGKMSGNPVGNIGMAIDHPIQNSIQSTAEISYQPLSMQCQEYLPAGNAEVFITKLYTINKIVSGRFQFVGYCNNGDSTNMREITQGRFDLKLDVVNE